MSNISHAHGMKKWICLKEFNQSQIFYRDNDFQSTYINTHKYSHIRNFFKVLKEKSLEVRFDLLLINSPSLLQFVLLFNNWFKSKFCHTRKRYSTCQQINLLFAFQFTRNRSVIYIIIRYSGKFHLKIVVQLIYEVIVSLPWRIKKRMAHLRLLSISKTAIVLTLLLKYSKIFFGRLLDISIDFLSVS